MAAVPRIDRDGRQAPCRPAVPIGAYLLMLCCAALGCSVAAAQVVPPEEEDSGAIVETQSAEYALWVAYGYSDNILREADAQDSTFESAGVEFDLARERERLSAGLSGELQVRRYDLDALDQEQVGEVDANAEVRLIPERFSWSFFDSFGQGRTDPFAAVGPLNRQYVNFFSTGPTISIPAGTRTELLVTALYQDYRHEETRDFDSETLSWEAGLMRQIGPVSRLGIVADSEDIEYAAGVEPYTIRGAVLRYERRFSEGEVTADLGVNELAVAGSTERGPRIILSWLRPLTTRSTLGIGLSREFTDSGAFFAFSATEALVGDRTEVLLTPSPLEQSRVELFYELATGKTQLGLGFSVAREEFSSDPTLDNDSSTIQVSFDRRLTARSSLTFLAEQVDRDFSDSVGETGDRFMSLFFDFRMSRLFVLQLGATSYDRTGAEDFGERRYEVRLRLDPL